MPIENTQPCDSEKDSPSPVLSPTQVFEWFNIATGAWWVYLFTLPGSLFLTTPAFNSLANHAPEWQWALAIFGAVCLSLLSLLRPHPLLCVLSLTVQAGNWAGVATFLALSAPVIQHMPVNTGVGVYAAMAVFNLLLCCECGENAVSSLRLFRPFRVNRYG